MSEFSLDYNYTVVHSLSGERKELFVFAPAVWLHVIPAILDFS